MQTFILMYERLLDDGQSSIFYPYVWEAQWSVHKRRNSSSSLKHTTVML
jgi:hypothetical protein